MTKRVIFKNRKFAFSKLVFELFKVLDNGVLRKIQIDNCRIVRIPKNSIIWHKFKFRGRWFETFCGFLMEDSSITRNVFVGMKELKKVSKKRV